MAKKQSKQEEVEAQVEATSEERYKSALEFVFKHSGERGIVNYVGGVLGIDMEEFHAANAKPKEENATDKVPADDADTGSK